MDAQEIAKWLFSGGIAGGVTLALICLARATFMKDKEIRANRGGSLSVVGNQKDLIDAPNKEVEKWKKDYFNERARADDWQQKYYALLEKKGGTKVKVRRLFIRHCDQLPPISVLAAHCCDPIGQRWVGSAVRHPSGRQDR